MVLGRRHAVQAFLDHVPVARDGLYIRVFSEEPAAVKLAKEDRT
jgi:hypothetical protein